MSRKRKKLEDDSRPSKSLIDTEKWQLHEIQAGLVELDAGKTVSHSRVQKWLSSWGQRTEQSAPR